MRVPLSKPSYMSYINEIKTEVNKVIDSGMIAAGEKVKQFEQMITEYIECKHAIAVSSGTSGLIIALKSLGIGEGDEVITSPFSFVASTNCILECGATPVYVDIDRNTYNIDTTKIKPNQRTKAILPIDIFGNPIDTNKINNKVTIGECFNNSYVGTVKTVPIVLDSCESLGSNMDRPFDVCVYAGYPNKQIALGEGAVICTNNDDIADFARSYRNQGRASNDTWLNSSRFGLNYRMTDIEATFGIVQMRYIDKIINKRKKVWSNYLNILFNMFNEEIPFKLQNNRFDDILQVLNQSTNISPFVFTVEVDSRDKVMQHLLDNGIECKPYFPCIHLQQYMRDKGYKEGMYPIAEEVSSKTLALPFYTDMTDTEIDYVCTKLKEVLNGV